MYRAQTLSSKLHWSILDTSWRNFNPPSKSRNCINGLIHTREYSNSTCQDSQLAQPPLSLDPQLQAQTLSYPHHAMWERPLRPWGPGLSSTRECSGPRTQPQLFRSTASSLTGATLQLSNTAWIWCICNKNHIQNYEIVLSVPNC